jgi:hypothetical protein
MDPKNYQSYQTRHDQQYHISTTRFHGSYQNHQNRLQQPTTIEPSKPVEVNQRERQKSRNVIAIRIAEAIKPLKADRSII